MGHFRSRSCRGLSVVFPAPVFADFNNQLESVKAPVQFQKTPFLPRDVNRNQHTTVKTQDVKIILKVVNYPVKSSQGAKMGSSEKFCLRWNDFESNISVAFRELREEKDFFDVTLACDDSQVQAHKVILSACSPFLRNILRRNPHQHPLLYLKGVKYTDLQSVLNFMYHGEVNVAQEELNSFLAVAEDLRVKGLTQNNSSSDSKPKSEPPKINRPPPPREPQERDPLPPPKRPRPTPPSVSTPQQQSYQQEDDDDIQEVVPVKSEPRDPVPMPQSMTTAMAPVVDNASHYQPEQVSHNPNMQQPQPNAVALDDSYADESYDYGRYGEYDDGSGMIDPNTGMPMQGAGADGNKGKKAFYTFTYNRTRGLQTA